MSVDRAITPAKGSLDIRRLPPPEPAQGSEAYARQRETALEFDPRRRENYEKFLRSTRGEDVDYLPVKLDIENVSRCNFRCTMCVVSDWLKGQRAKDMPVDDFKRLIDEQYGLVEIKLQGVGEPLLQRDAFFEMIRYARSRAIWVRTTTNASLLHLHGNYKKLIDSDPSEVQVSIDGADKETFESIRRGSTFERVVQNCKLINEYGALSGVSRTKMWTVVQVSNVHQLSDLVSLARDLGFTSQTFSLTLSDWGQEAWRAQNEEISVDSRLNTDALLELANKGKALGVRVSFWSVVEKYRAGDRRTLCPWPFERAFISSDLRVVPCCYVGNPDIIQIGSALAGQETMASIWQSQAYKEFRRAHLIGNIPTVCKGCYSSET